MNIYGQETKEIIARVELIDQHFNHPLSRMETNFKFKIKEMLSSKNDTHFSTEAPYILQKIYPNY